jgi:hypothetical protein
MRLRGCALFVCMLLVSVGANAATYVAPIQESDLALPSGLTFRQQVERCCGLIKVDTEISVVR